MTDALRKILPDTTWIRPGGGFFLWVNLPATIDAERLFPIALAQGVAYVPGAAFSNQNGFKNAARLCFAFPKPSEMATGLQRLKTAIDIFQREHPR